MNEELTKGKKIERKRKSAELERAAIEWQETFDAIIDIVILVSSDFELLRINRAGCKVVGKKPEELIGKKCYEVMHGLDAPINGCPFAKTKRTKKAEVAEFIQGGKHYIATSSPIFNKNHELVAAAHLVKDVTELKRLEEERVRAATLATTVDAMVDPVFVIDLEGRCVSANRACSQMFGLEPKDIVGKPIMEMLGIDKQKPAEVKKFMSLIGEAIERGSAGPVELVLVAMDGREIPMSIAGGVIKDAQGNPAHIVAVLRDITERKRSEDVLRESEERHRAIFEQAADSIVLVNAETGALVEFNDMAHENLGYTREEFAKLKIPDFEVIESTEKVAKHIEKIIKEGADTFETKHMTKGGEIRDIQVRSRAISIRGKDFVQSIWRDITERKQAEKERLKIATDKKRMEELEKFAKIAVGRELRMVELKKRIKELESKLKEITGKG